MFKVHSYNFKLYELIIPYFFQYYKFFIYFYQVNSFFLSIFFGDRFSICAALKTYEL